MLGKLPPVHMNQGLCTFSPGRRGRGVLKRFAQGDQREGYLRFSRERISSRASFRNLPQHSLMGLKTFLSTTIGRKGQSSESSPADWTCAAPSPRLVLGLVLIWKAQWMTTWHRKWGAQLRTRDVSPCLQRPSTRIRRVFLRASDKQVRLSQNSDQWKQCVKKFQPAKLRVAELTG